MKWRKFHVDLYPNAHHTLEHRALFQDLSNKHSLQVKPHQGHFSLAANSRRIWFRVHAFWRVTNFHPKSGDFPNEITSTTTNHFRFRVFQHILKILLLLPWVLKFHLKKKNYLQNPHVHHFLSQYTVGCDLATSKSILSPPKIPKHRSPAVPTVTLKRSVAIDNGTPKEGLMFQRLPRCHSWNIRR